MRRVLVDPGAIYAFVVRTDVHHEEAQTFVRDLLSEKGVLVLADLVFAETMTLMKARIGAGLAVRVGVELRRNPLYVWTQLGTNGERETWAAFQQYKNKEWSYTDCAILTLSQRLNVTEVFAFVRHFENMPGLVRVP